MRLGHRLAATAALLTLGSGVTLGNRALAQDEDASSPPEVGMQVGQLHPDLLLPAVDPDDERYLSLASLRGRKLLLFHFASW